MGTRRRRKGMGRSGGEVNSSGSSDRGWLMRRSRSRNSGDINMRRALVLGIICHRSNRRRRNLCRFWR